ncbi:MAG: hypothetical protein N2109_08975 [Fimbriimonadales bacterium]|nr:hypothetical protein [Fimbriimonadales bacterium]
MRRSWIVLVALTCWSSALAIDVYPNNPAGDFFVNAGPSNASLAVGSSGWYYMNVRHSGGVGINGLLPYLGTGSVLLSGVSGLSKADIEYWKLNNLNVPQPLGLLSALDAISYSWHRVGSSTIASHLHPSLRLFVGWLDGTTWKSGYLVYEEIYNDPSFTAPTDTWVDVDAIGKKFWSTGSLPDAFSSYDRTLSQWSSLMPGAVVLGFSMGAGSGWNGVFTGAVDNFKYSFAGGSSGEFNFEVQSVPVPEPFTMALGAAGLAAALRRRSRR